MARSSRPQVGYSLLELDGVRYAILREQSLRAICRRIGVSCGPQGSPAVRADAGGAPDFDQQRFAWRLIARRKRAGLSQVELARRAGVRAETLNRLEKGRTTPDFATVRKLVEAMNAAEAESPETIEQAANSSEE